MHFRIYRFGDAMSRMVMIGAWFYISIACPARGSNTDVDFSLRDQGSRSGIYQRLMDQRRKSDLKQIKRTFVNIDELLDQAVVKVQSVGEDGALGPERICSLSWFLSEPHSLSEIESIIEATIKRKISDKEHELLLREKDLSFPRAVKELWKAGTLKESKARALIGLSVITYRELIRLLENGAVRTASGYLIKVRTGKSFGDPLKLFDDISNAMTAIRETMPDLKMKDLPTLALCPEIASALAQAGLPPEESLYDAQVIEELRKHFLFLETLYPLTPFDMGIANFDLYAPTGPAEINRSNLFDVTSSLNSLSVQLIGNHYLEPLNASVTNFLRIDPTAMFYSGRLNFEGHGPNWWLYYTDGFFGGGLNYTANFDQGTFWSRGDPSYLSAGIMAGGWGEDIIGGISLSTAFGQGIGLGVGITMSISRSHDVTYLGEYPIDGKFAEIRGLHKIEIDDTAAWSSMLLADLELPVLNLPLVVAFRASKSHTRRRLYRTHADLERVKAMIMDAPGTGILHLLGKQIRESRTPRFEDPEVLLVGDELVETKTGKLSGAFILGIESLIPLPSLAVGGIIDVSAVFELGLRRLPNDKFEISIEPKRLYEMGVFINILNLFQAGHMKSMSIARKQIFMFDFKNPEAKRAYFDLIHHGILPVSEDIEIYMEDRGPEYLLTEFRAQNDVLSHRGIARTYLEKVRIATSKKYVGLTPFLFSAGIKIVNKIEKKSKKYKGEPVKLKFTGFDRQHVVSKAESVATNGLISVKRITFGGRRSEGQGFSGRYNRDLFVTHKRIHAIDDNQFDFSSNRWQFDSLVIQGRLEDTVITGDQENQIAEEINRLFGTFVGSFEQRNSRSLRIIDLERTLTKKELDELTRNECRDRISTASQVTGIDQQSLTMLLKKLKNKHPDQQGLILKHFIEGSPGLTGFAAIHQLLGARPEHLFIRTVSGYVDAVLNAKEFIATHIATAEGEEERLDLVPIEMRKNRNKIKKFFGLALFHLREIDKQLRLLKDDRYLIDDDNPLIKIYGNDKVMALVQAGIRQDKTAFKSALVTARKAIVDLLDLKRQGFSHRDRMIIYGLAGKKRLRLNERIELLLNKYGKPIYPTMEERYIKKRVRRAWKIISEIDSKITEAEGDTIMQAMDPEYVDRSIKQLYRMRRRIARIASLAHLDEDELRQMEKMFRPRTNKAFGFMHKKRYNSFRINGALAQAYDETDGSPDQKNIAE